MRRADAFSRFRLWNKQIKLVSGERAGAAISSQLTKDEARLIAANIAKLPELLAQND